METQMWTVIGLLGASFLALVSIVVAGILSLRAGQQRIGSDVRFAGDRIADLTVRVGAVETKIDAHDRRFDAIDKCLEAHDRRFDVIDNRLEAHDRRFDAIDRRFDGVDQRLDAHDLRFDAHDRRFDELEELIRSQGRELGDALYRLTEQFREHLHRHAS